MRIRSSLAAAVSAVLISFAAMLPAGVASPLEVLALTGDPAPGGPEGAVFLEFGLSEINSRGQVVFAAAMEPGVAGVTPDEALGVWYGSAGSAVTPVLVGDPPAPGIPGAFFERLATAPQFSDDGSVSIDMILEVGPGGVAFSDDWGRWLFTLGGDSIVYREGTAPPGVDPNAELFTAAGPMNRVGDHLMRGTLEIGPGGITSSRTGVLWKRLADGTETFLAQNGSSVPGAPSGVFFSNVSLGNLNDRGHVVAFARFRQGLGGVDESNDSGLFSDRSGQYTLEYRKGDTGSGGAVFDGFGGALINNNDRLLFQTSYPLEPNDPNGFPDTALWAESENGLRLVAETDTIAPGTGGRTLDNITDIRWNDAGRAAFLGSFSIVGRDWLLSEGLTGELTLVAEEGAQAPGTETDVRFDSDLSVRLFASDLEFNNAGQVSFASALSGPGISAANDVGLWAQDLQGDLHLVVREGDAVEVAPGDSRTVEQFFSSGMNERGQVGFDAKFTDGTFGVFVSNVAARLPGDYNGDGLVDAADYTVWRDNEADAGIGLAADGNGDNAIDGADRDLWAANYGVGMAPDTTTTVPEPTALAAALLAGLIATLGSRR